MSDSVHRGLSAADSNADGNTESSDLVSLMKDQNALLKQIHHTLLSTKSSATGSEQTNNPDEHQSLLGEPESRKWASLSSFLLHYQHENGPTPLSAERGKLFLQQAKDTFHTVTDDLRLFRAHVLGSDKSRHDASIFEAFEQQHKKWPEALSVDESLGVDRVFHGDSNIFVHESVTGMNEVTFGSVWTVTTATWVSEEPTMDPRLITAIILILQSCQASLELEIRSFLLHYLGDLRTSFSPQLQTRDVEVGDSILWIPFHLRCFGNVQNLGKGTKSAAPKIFCRRFQAIDLGIRERCRSVALLCPFVPAKLPEAESTGNYVILRLLDDGWNHSKYDENLSTTGLPLCKPWTGLTMFQRIIWGELDWWEESWIGVLETIDNLVAFEISDILDADSRQKLMYDDHKLHRSETYFTVVQLLRIFEEWTSYPEEDISILLDQTEYELKTRVKSSHPEARRIIQQNWLALLLQAQRSRNKILGLIQRRRDEIESLRDGLYNTMQVREATRGTKMNEIMLLFTIATIVYLPPTFVATFMGLDLFQTSDQTQFWEIFGTASAVTYLLAALGLLTIYRKGFLDWTRIRFRALVSTHASPPGSEESTFLEREKKKRHKERMDLMQRAKIRRTPVRRSTFQSVFARTRTGESQTARDPEIFEQPPEPHRRSQATVLSQAMWLSQENISPTSPRLFKSPSPLSQRSPASPSAPFHNNATPLTLAQDTHAFTRFTTNIPGALRNLPR